MERGGYHPSEDYEVNGQVPCATPKQQGRPDLSGRPYCLAQQLWSLELLLVACLLWFVRLQFVATEAGADVPHLKVGQLLKDLFGGEAIRKEVQHIYDTYAHTSYAGTPAALLRIDGDPRVVRV